MLAPFLGFTETPDDDPDNGRFNDYLENSKGLFELVDNPGDCEIAVYPHEFNGTVENLSQIREIAHTLKQLNKKLLLFYNADDDTRLEIENTFVFRTSLYKSRQNAFEFALPGWSVDFKKYFPGETISILQPETMPTVSYCGYIDNSSRGIKERIKSFLKPKPATQEEKAKYRRGETCRRLIANENVATDFIIRTGFWAQGMRDKNAARLEYAQNMISSLYGIVTRGGGNFSYRMYEMLSCGRIPLFINTDCVLPFDDEINWKDHVVWIEEKDLFSIDKLLLDFHLSKSQEELIALQKKNRKLYEEFISPLGFHKSMIAFIRQKLI